MKLTLGRAAKAAGISKPSLSAAIKKGRLSALKNESGVYEIDPAELFRVYPKKTNTNMEANSESLPDTNPVSGGGLHRKGGGKEIVDLVLAERDKLITEKDRAIERLEREKGEIREDFEDQKEQTKRITLLLDNRSSGAGEWERAIKALEARLSNQEKAEKAREQREEKILRQNKALRNALQDERSRGFFKKLFG